jgi:hypothetical protein
MNFYFIETSWTIIWILTWFLYTESIELFIEDQAYLLLYIGSFLPFPSAICLSFSVFLCVAGRAYWREREGGGAKAHERENACSSINHALLYAVVLRCTTTCLEPFLYGKLIFLNYH